MKRSEVAFTLALLPMDFLAILGAAGAAFALRFHPYFTAMRPVVFNLQLSNFLKVVFPVAILWILVFAFAGLYKTRRVRIAAELSRLLLASSTAMAMVFAVTFFSRTLFDSRFLALAGWLLAIVFVVLTRLIVRGLQRSLLRLGIGVERIVLIGKNTTTDALITEFNAKPRLGYAVIGQYKKFDNTLADKLAQMARNDKLDAIVLADNEASRETRLALLSLTDSEHLGFLYSADLLSAAIGRALNHTFAGIPMIEVQKTPLDGWGGIYKRAFDFVGALVLIVMTSPILFLTALAIKLDSRGPIFFSQVDKNMPSTRIGQNGKPFRYFKFRSMRPDTHAMRYHELADSDTRKGPLVKIKNDPRVTRVGRFIRAYSIDELPEFFLVLAGKMSLVGPRPHLPEEVEKYRPEHKKVHAIKPGITGMAQISGRADLDFEDEVRLDTYYIEHWSPWLDIYILLKTPLVVLCRKGAS